VLQLHPTFQIFNPKFFWIFIRMYTRLFTYSIDQTLIFWATALYISVCTSRIHFLNKIHTSDRTLYMRDQCNVRMTRNEDNIPIRKDISTRVFKHESRCFAAPFKFALFKCLFHTTFHYITCCKGCYFSCILYR